MSDWDYVIVGGGSAGCVLANRLSEDPDIRVLLLEQGGDDGHWLVRMPKGNGRILLDPRFTAYHKTSHDRGAAGGEHWLRGAALGGSSTVNGMVWVRGQPEDFDHWAELGNQGWGWSDMLPYFRKIENHALGDDGVRGVGGAIQVTPHRRRSRLADAFIASAAVLGAPAKDDLNALAQEGAGYLSYNIDRRGRRSSAGRAFLRPARGRPNLRIETGVAIDRIVVENGRAVGVSGTRRGQAVEYRTAGEVISSAGTIGSTRLLQLSGIGPAAHLRGLGIDIIADRHGVGRNLREHWLLALEYALKQSKDSENRAYSGAGLIRSMVQYLAFGKGPMSTGGFSAAAFVRSGPGLNRPDGQLMMAPWSREGLGAFRSFPSMHVFTYQLRPESRGSIAIESADPRQPCLIAPNYLSTEGDRTTSIALIRGLRRVMEQPAIKALHQGETDRTNWAREDEQIIDAYRTMGAAGQHACGTCAMGQGPEAVVDERLRVHGIEGLRVIDLSVFPEMASGNTNAPVMAVAMRAGDLVIEDRRSRA